MRSNRVKLQVVDTKNNKVVKEVRNSILPVNLKIESSMRGTLAQDEDTSSENQHKQNIKVPVGNENKPSLTVTVKDGLVTTEIVFVVDVNFPVANNIFFEIWHGSHLKELIRPSQVGNVFSATDYHYDDNATPESYHVLVKVLDQRYRVISVAVCQKGQSFSPPPSMEIVNFERYERTDSDLVFYFPAHRNGQTARTYISDAFSDISDFNENTSLVRQVDSIDGFVELENQIIRDNKMTINIPNNITFAIACYTTKVTTNN